jgi:outer membrane protein assembly factor BamE (lipoprotein component of BamABCDE complex)
MARVTGLRLVAVLMGGAVVAACSPMVANHGHHLDEQALAQLRPGQTSREEVLRTLGSPSATATFDQDTWYYIQQRKERMSFYQNELVEQKVVAVHFDERGVVRAVDRRGLEDANDITPVADATPTHGTEMSVVQQFLGNLGRFVVPDDGPVGPTGTTRR